jgi:hypothetical protein
MLKGILIATRSAQARRAAMPPKTYFAWSVYLRTPLYFRAFTGQTCGSELIADLVTKRSRLRKGEVLSIGGTPTTNQACLRVDRFDVVECDASVVAF